ncbi:MAG: hypothetical protein LRY73_07140 [Bacillus sp. (in: Bacteria)]|nr:hypothetical protein [Bacillus sp. (in: firmicutes)]
MRSLFQEGCRILELEESEWDYVVGVIKGTSENESSMLTDRKQRKKTEIMAISGYILQLAEKVQLEAPVTKFVHQSIVGVEEEKKKDE